MIITLKNVFFKVLFDPAYRFFIMITYFFLL